MSFTKALALSLLVILAVLSSSIICLMAVTVVWIVILVVPWKAWAIFAALWLGLAVVRLFKKWNPDIGLDQFKDKASDGC